MEESIQESEWYKTRPQIIKDMVDKYPPGLYKIKSTNEMVQIYSYFEDGKVNIFNPKDYDLVMAIDGKGVCDDCSPFKAINPEELEFITNNND